MGNESNELDVTVEFPDGRVLEKVFVIGDKLYFKFVDEDTEEYEVGEEADYIYDVILAAIRHNLPDRVVEYYEKMKPVITEAEDFEYEEDKEIVEPDGAEDGNSEREEITLDMDEEPEQKWSSIKDLYAFISDANNEYNSEVLEISDEADIEDLGGQNFRVEEKQLPIDVESNLMVRYLVGKLDGDDDAVFCVIPDNIAEIKDDDDTLDLEALNSGVSCNAIVSENLTLEDPKSFYDALGELYGSGAAFSMDASVGEESGMGPEEEKPEEAELMTLDTDEFAEAVSPIPYKTALNEKWLDKFSTTDDFRTKVNEFCCKLKKALPERCFDYVSVVLGESNKYFAVRIDKESLFNDSVNKDWFKKRLSRVCEAVKACAEDVRIVETRGSYYTRTFFMVEAIPQNYCISDSDSLYEMSISADGFLLEGSGMENESRVRAYLRSRREDKYVVKPTLYNDLGESISYVVDNDGKLPVFITEGDRNYIRFIPKSMIETTQTVPAKMGPVGDEEEEDDGKKTKNKEK